MKTLSLAAAFAAFALTTAVAQDAPHPQLAQASKSQPKPDCGTLPEPFAGLAFAGDGDTIYFVGMGPSVRLWGLQAPELRDKVTGQETVAGMRTRAALEDLLQGADHKVACSPRKFDRFCRVVASCTTQGPGGAVDLSLDLLRQGLAYGFWLSDTPADDGALSLAYAGAEAEARKQRRGLWKEWLGEK